MTVFETQRLVASRLSVTDAEFILKLVNEPGWLQYIGDKNVSTLGQARDYILSGPIQMYDDFGFGLYRVQLKSTLEPIGVCGLLQREGLSDVDLGFAFLSVHQGNGYAVEAASGTCRMRTQCSK